MISAASAHVSEYAWIDPTFNAIHPRGVILQRDLANLSGMGPWPPTMLAPFMHELTHHWCFRATAGNILAAMNLRACEVAVFGTKDHRAFSKAAHDHLTFRATLEFLRPLLEGMALFAEFDSQPGQAKVISDAQLFAWLACATEMPRSERELSTLAATALRAERTSHTDVARKVGVLKHPNGTFGRAYFDGYLMVRSLHRAMSRLVPQAEETDWFLSYLRDFIFSDPGLVITLLSDPPAGVAKIDAVIRHISERLWALLHVDEEQAKAYSASVNEPSRIAAGPSWPAGIDSRKEDEQDAATLADKFFDWYAGPCSAEQEQWRRLVLQVLDQRRVATVAAEQVPIRTRSGAIEVLLTSEGGGQTYHRIGALSPTLADRETVGWAAVLLCFDGHPVVATALGDATGLLGLRTRPQEAIDNPLVRSRLVDGLIAPPVISELKASTEQAFRLLRAEVTRRFGESDVEAHARCQAGRIAQVFVDMMSEDWRYGWDIGSEAQGFERGQPSKIFENGGVWPLFAPNAAMFNTYIRAAAGAQLNAAAMRNLKVFTTGIEERFGIRLIERVSGKLRFWL